MASMQFPTLPSATAETAFISKVKVLKLYSKQALELTRTLLEAPASQPEYAPGSARFTTHGDLCEYGLALLDFFPDVPAASASTLILRRFAAPRRIPPGHVGEE
jgi:hypothetical protein